MREIEAPPVDKDVAQAAADWVVRLSREVVDEADALAFIAWIDRAPHERPDLHRAAFDHAQALWLDADQLAAIAPAPRPWLDRDRITRRWLAWSALAAAASILLILGGWRFASPNTAPQPTAPLVSTYATLAGQRRVVALADGSRIELDGETVLTLSPFTPRERFVALLHGEAMFNVVRDPARPFSVALGPARVEVLGTAFDIVRASEDTEVSVSRGAVRFVTPHGRVDLPAGRTAKLTDHQVSVGRVAVADVGAWRKGRRLYRDQSLSQVVSDLNRGSPQVLRLGDAKARRMRFTGVLVLGPREAMVRRLTALLPLRAHPDTAGVVVLSSRGP